MTPDPNLTSAEPSGVTMEGETFATPAERLRYVETSPPAGGAAVAIAPGVLWCRIPLPIDLNHINVWLLDHEDGYVLVDTGMPMDECKAAWHALEQSVLATKPLRAILVTHFHTDHAGLAPWLQARHGVPVWTSAGTQKMLAIMGETITDERLQEAEAFLVSHGVTQIEKFRPMLSGSRSLRSIVGDLRVERHIADNEVLRFGDREWRALEVHGHADAHLCLSNEADRVLISGDQILPRISSNIGLMWRTQHPDPLAAYFESLDRLSQLAQDTLVLPSHGQPFRALQVRAADLAQHHRDELKLVVDACAEPRTVQDIVSFMYKRPLHGVHRMLAFAEAYAHLEHLRRAGRLRQVRNGQGIYQFVA